MCLSRPASGGGPRRLVASLALSVIFHGIVLLSIWSKHWFAADAKVFASGASLGVLSVTFRREAIFLSEPREPVVVLDDSVKPSLSIESPGNDLGVGADEPKGQQIAAGEMQVVKPKEAGPDDYLPREKLTTSARPLNDIRIPWPSFLPTIGMQSAVFTLFIDEFGKVREMVPDGHTLPPVMEDVSRKAFMATAFRPALVDGRPVKSIQRIEVFFEYMPLPQAAEPSGIVSRTELK